jgi:RNA polymerase subunit RPABC4/transcription elongation factor Spt4
MHIRVCPECGEEYRPDVQVCAECGGVLEDQFEDEGAPAGLETPLPPSVPVAGPQRTVFSSSEAADLEPLAHRLGTSGIPFAVRGAINSFDLLVQAADVERALEALKDLLPQEDPQPRAAFDPERGYASCPACGTPLAPGAAACPECGLAIGGPATGDVCPRCHSPLDPARQACPSCGFWES